MSAMRSSIRAATPLLRACGPNAVRRTYIGIRAPAASLTQLPSRQQCVTPVAVRCYASSAEQANSKTGLYDLHVSKGAKMVPFGGFMMPVQYSDLGVGESHKWTREKASLFDVSHMVQYHFTGPGATAFLEKITPADLQALPPHQSTLSALLHPQTGGIVDDTIITRLTEDKFYVVTNAGCREKDAAFLTSNLDAWNNANQPRVDKYELKNQGLVALQGPLAADILQSVLAPSSDDIDLKSLYFGSSRFLTLRFASGETSKPVLASRGGYTGEDGFEISVAPEDTVAVTELLLTAGGPEKLRLAGLGARDSLRLEAGMCLYGHDLDDSTTPVEGALGWIVAKSRRSAPRNEFNGAELILPQLVPVSKGGKGVSRRRVGLLVEGAPAREGAQIVDAEGQIIGAVTSGCPSPTLKKNIAMGYVKDGQHKSGTELGVVVRGKTRKATVTKMPFVPSKYWKGGISPA
ncbi:glycine cleavage system T protein [Aureobasidium pullulans]|nr:glycine cleavage system T protein [Aureobasidium pullulans]